MTEILAIVAEFNVEYFSLNAGAGASQEGNVDLKKEYGEPAEEMEELSVETEKMPLQALFRFTAIEIPSEEEWGNVEKKVGK